MTLAMAILLFGFSFAPSVMGWDAVWAQSAQQTDPTQSNSTPSIQDQSSPQTIKPSTTSTSKAPSRKSSGKKRVKKTTQKTPATSGCESSPTAPENNGTTDSQSSSATQNGVSPTAPKNCPPEKIVVRQGGTTEPAIRLAGGDQESQKRNEANQMLGSTDANLKKISGIQLSPEQQDTVSQIQQFVVESKAALAAGDMERGHTLAWKAQLLSEDLVKPQK